MFRKGNSPLADEMSIFCPLCGTQHVLDVSDIIVDEVVKEYHGNLESDRYISLVCQEDTCNFHWVVERKQLLIRYQEKRYVT